MIGLTLYFASLTGAISLPGMAQHMSENKKAVGLPFDLRWWGLFKTSRLQVASADVIYISSSRAGTFRQQMFRPYIFYNMSFTAWSVDQAISALSQIIYSS